jgi:hypothetical protein
LVVAEVAGKGIFPRIRDHQVVVELAVIGEVAAREELSLS